MKIIVSIKQVPSRDSNLKINGSGTWLDDSDLTYEMNEPDAYALEEALQLKEKLGGEVVVVCLGPSDVTQTIREALAKGADRAIHVETDEAPADALVTARLLAKAIGSEAPDFILTGLQSDDLGYGQTGVLLAEILGFAHATIVMEVEPQPPGSVRVKRELEDGWFQHVALPLPVVLTIQSGIKRLRYATLMGIKRAKTKEVRLLKASELETPSGQMSNGFRLYSPERSKQLQVLTGDPKKIAHDLVEKLRFEARVI